ncbi:MAG: N-acetyltransferase [Herpetosiphonaceae bacterium]|nr:MAG: N-acetyltransferase [Herpetosiphonaceae bacterium]
MSIEIRRMTLEDITAVQEVARITWAHTYEGIIPSHIQEQFLNAAYSPAALQRRLENDIFLLAVQHGHVVGFADFAEIRTGGVELAAIYILPEAQGKGIGTRLLRAGIEALGSRPSLRVVVERDNRAARLFYEARGFQLIREYSEIVFGHSFSLVEMRLALEGADSGQSHTGRI